MDPRSCNTFGSLGAWVQFALRSRAMRWHCAAGFVSGYTSVTLPSLFKALTHQLFLFSSDPCVAKKMPNASSTVLSASTSTSTVSPVACSGATAAVPSGARAVTF